MLNISVKHDLKRLSRDLNSTQRKQLPKVVTQALNRTATQAQSTAIKSIASETGIKQKDVKQAFKIRKANWRNLLASITATGKALNIIRFGARQVAKGVSAAPWKKRRIFKGAFIANQGRTVFVRKTADRLPIKPLHGPSIPRELVRGAVETAWRKTIRERFPINFAQAVRRYFPKR